MGWGPCPHGCFSCAFFRAHWKCQSIPTAPRQSGTGMTIPGIATGNSAAKCWNLNLFASCHFQVSTRFWTFLNHIVALLCYFSASDEGIQLSGKTPSTFLFEGGSWSNKRDHDNEFKEDIHLNPQCVSGTLLRLASYCAFWILRPKAESRASTDTSGFTLGDWTTDLNYESRRIMVLLHISKKFTVLPILPIHSHYIWFFTS